MVNQVFLFLMEIFLVKMTLICPTLICPHNLNIIVLEFHQINGTSRKNISKGLLKGIGLSICGGCLAESEILRQEGQTGNSGAGADATGGISSSSRIPVMLLRPFR